MEDNSKHQTDNDYLFAKYKDVDSFISVIKEFDAIDLRGNEPHEIERIFYDYFAFIPSIWFGQKIERFNKHIFYRIRKNIDKNEEAIDLVSTYSYPSSKLCIKNGRANLKGKSVFYCSDNAVTALMEVELVPGDI